jgi:hypothetical protein
VICSAQGHWGSDHDVLGRPARPCSEQVRNAAPRRPRRKTRNPHQNSELLRNVAGIVAVNLVLAASQDSAIDNLGPPLRRPGGHCSGLSQREPSAWAARRDSALHVTCPTLRLPLMASPACVAASVSTAVVWVGLRRMSAPVKVCAQHAGARARAQGTLRAC